MAEKIEVTYTLEDGFVGGRRAHHFEIDPEDFIGMSQVEIEGAIAKLAEEHMRANVSPVVAEIAALVTRVTQVIDRIEAEDEETNGIAKTGDDDDSA